MKKLTIAVALALGICAGTANYALAEETPIVSDVKVHDGIVDGEPIHFAQADAAPAETTAPVASPGENAGSAAVVAPDPAPEVSDVGVVTKLWKSGAWLGLGIMAAFVALYALLKLDKKRAFYYATGLGGIVILVNSIRDGDTPSIVTVIGTLLPTVGLLIAGPNHVKATTP